MTKRSVLENHEMNSNLNEKCLLNYISSHGNKKRGNLLSLLKDFGVKIKNNKGYANEIYEIIEEYEYGKI